MEVKIEKISDNEIDVFLDILRSIAKWLITNGKEMWSLEGLKRDFFIDNNKEAEMYICTNENDLVGAFMIKNENSFWWPDIVGDDTFFLKKFGITQDYRGTRVSSVVLNLIKSLAKERKKKYIRIEFYADRDYLRRFYEEHGFEFVKLRIMPDGIEILLYEYRIT